MIKKLKLVASQLSFIVLLLTVGCSTTALVPQEHLILSSECSKTYTKVYKPASNFVVYEYETVAQLQDRNNMRCLIARTLEEQDLPVGVVTFYVKESSTLFNFHLDLKTGLMIQEVFSYTPHMADGGYVYSILIFSGAKIAMLQMIAGQPTQVPMLLGLQGEISKEYFEAYLHWVLTHDTSKLQEGAKD